MPQGNNEEQQPNRLSLDSINASAVDAAPVDADACTTSEELELARQKAVIASFTQDTGERKKYAKNIFVLTCSWVAGIYLILLLQGFGVLDFKLSDSVMLAAIGSTTANIIGVFLIVTRYFFPKKRA
jgi:hypothetical protein